MQYIELLREIDVNDEQFYLDEIDLIDVAVKHKFKWVISYILEKIVEANEMDHEGDDFGRYRIPLAYHNDLSLVFENWNTLREIIKNGYIG